VRLAAEPQAQRLGPGEVLAMVLVPPAQLKQQASAWLLALGQRGEAGQRVSGPEASGREPTLEQPAVVAVAAVAAVAAVVVGPVAVVAVGAHSTAAEQAGRDAAPLGRGRTGMAGDHRAGLYLPGSYARRCL
jgi:hypothetical protein